LTVGTEQWARLPADVRQVLEETAREVQAFALETAEELDTRLLRELRDAGMQINEADRESFVTASQAIYNEFATAVPGGRELIDRVLALAER
jgi:TRAP-type C4-dicarboxylate transport system substrate-binding protein